MWYDKIALQEKRGKKNEVKFVKAKTKTVLLSALAVLDCAFVGVIFTTTKINKTQTKDVKIMASANYVVEKNDDNIEQIVSEVLIQDKVKNEFEKNLMNVIVDTPLPKVEKIVYDGMTLNQLASKLNKSLKAELSGKGYLIASYSIQKKVDPYVATAIMLHETGCAGGSCSSVMKKCNNVGGMVGSGCGGYASFPTLDSGIKSFIDNLSKNYYAVGLNTPAKMNSKYASDKNWSNRVNTFASQIKAK